MSYLCFILFILFSTFILNLNGSFGLTCSFLYVSMCADCALFGAKLLDMPWRMDSQAIPNKVPHVLDVLMQDWLLRMWDKKNTCAVSFETWWIRMYVDGQLLDRFPSHVFFSLNIVEWSFHTVCSQVQYVCVCQVYLHMYISLVARFVGFSSAEVSTNKESQQRGMWFVCIQGVPLTRASKPGRVA